VSEILEKEKSKEIPEKEPKGGESGGKGKKGPKLDREKGSRRGEEKSRSNRTDRDEWGGGLEKEVRSLNSPDQEERGPKKGKKLRAFLQGVAYL